MKRLNIALLSTIDSPILGYIIQHLVDQNIPIDAVLIDTKKRSEKEKIIWAERTTDKLGAIPLCNFEAHQIPYYFFPNHSSEAALQFILNSNIDLLVNAGTPRILKQKILRAPRIGVLNCHPGLLPDFRGCTCVEWAIYLNEKIGNTVHLMTKEIDEGPIILQESLSLKKSDRYDDVRAKVYKHGFELIARGIRRLIEEPPYKFRNMSYVRNGRYFDVIDKDKMEAVLRSINAGTYKFQY